MITYTCKKCNITSEKSEYAQTLMHYIPDWSLLPLLAACFVSGILGALLGRVLLKKHFVRAGIV